MISNKGRNPYSRLPTLNYTCIKILSLVYLSLIAFLVQNIPCCDQVSGLLAHKSFLNVTSIFTHAECTQPPPDLWNQSTNSGLCHLRFIIIKTREFHLSNFVTCKKEMGIQPYHVMEMNCQIWTKVH